jgi:transitional endoplasmic reticulum ATPase
MLDATYRGRLDVSRITAVSEDHVRRYLEYPSGQSGYFDSDPTSDFEVGDVVFVDAAAGSVEHAPDEAWPDRQWVGVVKHRTDQDTVVEVGGRLVLLETNAVDYKVNHTVVGRDSAGVERVLLRKAIRSVDLGQDDEPDIEGRFRIDAHAGPSYSDFAGLVPVMRRAKELIELPLSRRDELERIGAKALKGVLFTGDPGTGKTMLARIIAREAGAAFYLVSGPQVFSKWFGESEQTLHAIFEAAAGHDRAIIFFDEIDSMASSRTTRGSEGQRSVVAQLLTDMDGFVPNTNVIVIAATNRPDDIDRALRRPGRFDSEIHFPLPHREDRLAILEQVASKHKATDDLPHELVADKTDGWSSAEVVSIFSEAALLAVADERDEISSEDYLGGFARAAAQQNARRTAEVRG